MKGQTPQLRGRSATFAAGGARTPAARAAASHGDNASKRAAAAADSAHVRQTLGFDDRSEHSAHRSDTCGGEVVLPAVPALVRVNVPLCALGLYQMCCNEDVFLTLFDFFINPNEKMLLYFLV